jgi:methyl-accepting chemotaxis protein
MARIVRSISTAEGAAAGAELIAGLRNSLGGERPALLVCFASMKQPLGGLLAQLSGAFEGVTVVGSSTAGQFTEEGEVPGAAVVVALVGDFIAHGAMAVGLKADPDGAVSRAVVQLPPATDGYPHRTAILLFDGLAGVGEEVTLMSASVLGDQVRFVGAAAGDDWAIQGTLVGVGARAAVDALALVLIDSRQPFGIGVAHGHRSIGVKTRVTRAEGSVVYELDGQPAWKRYAELTRGASLASGGVDPDSISDPGERLQYFARFQPGLSLGSGHKNRTPLSRLEDDALVFACGIVEGAEFELLSSTIPQQIDSARKAAALARDELGGKAVAGALVFECGCRKVFLGDSFDQAPKAVAAELGGIPLGGFESYGEVALNVGDFSGFHNATTVVLAIPEHEV